MNYRFGAFSITKSYLHSFVKLLFHLFLLLFYIEEKKFQQKIEEHFPLPYMESKKENGVGYVFEEGRIARVVEFVNGEEVKVIKEFDEKGKMREYDDNGDLVYIGDYCGNMKDVIIESNQEMII